MSINGPDCISFKDNDEYYTPAVMVNPILKYIKPESTIWCPFDTVESEYVRVLSSAGHRVLYSHIWEGKDFLEYEPDEPYDCIISNPPYSKRQEVLARLAELNMPYAMLFPITNLSLKHVTMFYIDKELQLLLFSTRIPFYRYKNKADRPPFNLAYFCENMLPKSLIITEVNTSGWEMSPMYEIYKE
jgi:hypothetical protein